MVLRMATEIEVQSHLSLKPISSPLLELELAAYPDLLLTKAPLDRYPLLNNERAYYVLLHFTDCRWSLSEPSAGSGSF